MPLDLTIGIGEIRTLTARAQNSGVDVKAVYTWTTSDGANLPFQDSQGNSRAAISNQSSVQITGRVAGSYTVTVAIGSSGVSDTFNITVATPSPDTLTLSAS